MAARLRAVERACRMAIEPGAEVAPETAITLRSLEQVAGREMELE